MVPEEKWPVLLRHERAAQWLSVWTDLGRAARTIDAYARGLAEFLEVCERHGVDPVIASRADVAVFVRVLTSRPSRHGANVVSIDSGSGLANATLQQRLVPVRLFFDYLIEEGVRESNPVGRGRYTPGRRFGGAQRGLVPRVTKLPWVPSEAEWLALLAAFRDEPPRNRLMLALAYDAALRREELCALRTDDLDPAWRVLRVRAETTKNRRERTVPYSAPTGLLLADYLRYRTRLSRARRPLFLSESRRNTAQPVGGLPIEGLGTGTIPCLFPNPGQVPQHTEVAAVGGSHGQGLGPGGIPRPFPQQGHGPRCVGVAAIGGMEQRRSPGGTWCPW